MADEDAGRPTLEGALSFDQALAEVRRRGLREIAGADGEYVGDLPLADDLPTGGGTTDPGYSLTGPYSLDRGGYSFPPGGGEGGGAGGGGGGGGWGGLSDFASKLGLGVQKEFSDSPLGSFSKLLGLGATGFNFRNQMGLSGQLKDAQALQKRSMDRADAAAAPAVAAGTADINRAQAGKLQPAMEASIGEWVQKAKADVQAKYAQMGLGNSSEIQRALAQIDKMALAMRGQLLQGEEALGGQLIGVGVNANSSGANMAAGQEKMLAELIAAANAQLGNLGGRSS